MKSRKFSTRLYLMYAIALFPLIIFGLYKNGISLYIKGLVDFLTMLKPLIILFMAVSGSLVGFLIKEWRLGNEINRRTLDKCKGNIIEASLVAAVLPIKSSPLVVFVIPCLFSLFLSKLKLNRIAVMYIVIESINVLCGLNSFNNAYLVENTLNYDGLDLFWGLGSGGIFSTNVLFIILGLIFLCFNKLYKKEMVFSSIIVFLLLGITSNMIFDKYTEIWPLIFGYNILFELVFILPNLYSSSYTVKGQILSGILVGIITFLIHFITPYTSAVIAILIVSLFKGVLDRIFVIK